jgi:hypothetical protein
MASVRGGGSSGLRGGGAAVSAQAREHDDRTQGAALPLFLLTVAATVKEFPKRLLRVFGDGYNLHEADVRY